MISAKQGALLFNHIKQQFYDNGLGNDLDGVIQFHHVYPTTKVLFLKGAVSTNSHGKDICNQQMDLKQMRNLFQQQEGITVSCEFNFITRKSSRVNSGGGLQIYWNDIVDLQSGIELYVKREKHFVAKDFYAYFGGTQNKMQIDTVVPQMERLSNEVRGDPLQMLEVQCAAYRAYSQILHNQIKYLNRKNAAARKTKEMQNTATTSHEIQFRALLEQELLSENYNCFVDHVNETFKNAFLGAGENWLKLGASIISKETTFEVLKEMKVKLPLCYTFFVTLSVSPSQKGRSRYEQSSHEKELMGLLAFLRGARQRNCKKLTWWALVNTIVYMSRGVTKIAIQKSVDDRDALSISACINNKLPQIRNSMENSAKRLLARETFVLVGFDNMQVVKPLKSQRDGRSSYSITGTVMYALCMDYILPKIGTTEVSCCFHSSS